MKKRNKLEKKEIEYPDAPSGFVTLYNYKEPFMPFKYEGEGYGYEGVLLFDGTSDKVQCHFCGNWFHALGNHIHKEHNMMANAYKKITGLRQTTALISENFRAKLIAKGQEQRIKYLKHGEYERTEEIKEKIRQTLKENRRESQNARLEGKGTCPAQLIERLQKKAEKLGRCPTLKDITYEATLRANFGTFTEACKIAGLIPQKPGQVRLHPNWIKEEEVINFVRDFWIKNNRFPKLRECPTARYGKKYHADKRKIDQKVLFGENKYPSNKKFRFIHTKTSLLEAIKIFFKTNNRLPSTSDCKRGLLPSASIYYQHFGSLKKALQEI